MESVSEAMKQLEDITECPICHELFTDPRMLPCIHSYCLTCIGNYSKCKQPGNPVACPLCRKDFTIPQKGISDLPKNFFIDKLLNIRKLTASENLSCDACSTDVEVSKQKEAAIYCLDCQQKMCETCQKFHKSMKVCASHKTVSMKDHLSSRDIFTKYPLANCEVHPDKRVELYCFQCKDTICISCYIETHNSHKCSDINKVGQDYRQQIADDFDKVETGAAKCAEIVQNLAKCKEDFVQQISKAQSEICDQAEQLKQMIETHKNKLVDELTSLKATRSQQIDTLSDVVRRHLTTMEGLKKYADEVKVKGTACDIVRAVNGLHDRADELLTFTFMEGAVIELGYVDVRFTASTFVVNNPMKTIGDVDVKKGQLLLQDLVGGTMSDLRLGEIRSRDLASLALLKIEDSETKVESNEVVTCSELIHRVQLSSVNVVSAMKSVGDCVYVVYKKTAEIEIYDASNMELKKRLGIQGLSDLPTECSCVQLKFACGCVRVVTESSAPGYSNCQQCYISRGAACKLTSSSHLKHSVNYQLVIAVCDLYHCAYIYEQSSCATCSNYKQVNNIYRVQLAGENTVQIWPTSVFKGCASLSVTKDHKLLLVGSDSVAVASQNFSCQYTLLTYTSYGDLLSTVNTRAFTSIAVMPLRLSSKNYATVSLMKKPLCHVIKITDGSTGNVVKSFAECRTDTETDYKYFSDVKQLALLNNGHILVLCSDSVLIIDPSELMAREIPVTIEGGFGDIEEIVLDESRDRLYVRKSSGLLLVYFNVILAFNARLKQH